MMFESNKVLLSSGCLTRRAVIFKRLISCTTCQLKKKKVHWSVLEKKQNATDKALQHFDDFYKAVFRLKWPSVRLALLSPQKYVALVNNFGDPEETQTKLANLGAMNLNSLLDVCRRHQKDQINEKKREDELNNIFAMDRLMENRAQKEEEKDLNLLYPDGSGDKLKGLFASEVKDDNTEENLQSEQLSNDSRIIDGDDQFGGSLNEFIPATKLKGMDDYVPEAEYYSYYKPTTEVPIQTEKEYKLNFPEHLRVYTFDRGDISEYPAPRRTSTRVYNYYLLDGSSLMPVLALGLSPGDRVLDMCAAPGGKSLAILQTMVPELLVCNDISGARVNRLHRVFGQFLYDYGDQWKNMLLIQNYDGAKLEESNIYDKILVDVPCTNDRHSLVEDENNIFKQHRVKERLRIPEKQAALLCNALRIVRPGGTVVYSTCSLSPVQNDGVVGMALRRMWDEHRLEFTIKDMTPALSSTSQYFNFGKNIGLKFGHLVVPFLPSNFGPTYFCKIHKNL